jgi:hypothetical protein
MTVLVGDNGHEPEGQSHGDPGGDIPQAHVEPSGRASFDSDA